MPFYREAIDRLGARPSDFHTATDLTRLPIVDRADLQRDPERFLSTAQPIERHERYRSSGGSGTPVTVHWDRRALRGGGAYVQRYESVIRTLLGSGVGGHRESILVRPRSNFARISGFLRDNIWAPRRLVGERQYLSVADLPTLNLARLHEFQPDIVRGYGSRLAELFQEAAKEDARLAPKLLVGAAEPIPEPARRWIEDQGIPVISSYGAIEAFHIGFQCERRSGYHLNVDLYPLRIVDPDGCEVADGESGEVVISNLVNRATMLLNYRLGDVATKLAAPCECGRSLPLLGSLVGRTDDWLEIGEGERLNALAVAPLINQERGVGQYQLRQSRPRQVEVVLVPAEGSDLEAIRSRLKGSLGGYLRGRAEVEVRFVDHLPTPRGGKRKVVVRAFSESVSK